MRIGLEAIYRPDWPAGILYIRNLVYALASLSEGDVPEIRLLPFDLASFKEVSDLDRFSFVDVAAPRLPDRGLDTVLLIRRASRRILQPRIGRVLHPAFAGLDLTFPDWGARIPRTPQIHWIQDLQHVHLPHLFDEDEIHARDKWIEKIAASDGMVILSSEAALRDFRAQHPDTRVKARVWRFCTTITERERGGRDPGPAYGLPEMYLYVGNQFWAHKDHLTLFESLWLLRDRGVAPKVVCTGRLEDYRNPDYSDRVRSYISDHGLGDQITILGYIDRRDQIEVMRRCAAVVQPSRFEGWSTVVEDAKAIGRPIVLSNIDVHKEQAKDGGSFRFFETGSPESLAEVLGEILPNLVPGPDPASEQRAEHKSRQRRRRAAEGFVSIANEVVERAR